MHHAFRRSPARLLTPLALAALLAGCATAPPAPPPPAAPLPVAAPAPAEDPRTLQAIFVADVGDRVFFGYDRFDLTPEAMAVLDRQAQFLAKQPELRVQVEGHADERGTREYNIALGQRRATAVRNYLVALGIAADRIETVSYGKERPAVLGGTEAVWSQNRRGVTALLEG